MENRLKVLVASLCLMVPGASIVPDCDASIKIVRVAKAPDNNARSACIYNNKAYLLAFFSGLSVWDLSDPSRVREIGRYDRQRDKVWGGKPVNLKYNAYSSDDGGIGQSRGGMSIAEAGSRILAFIPTGHHGLQAVDVTDPERIFNRGRAPYDDDISEGMSCAVRIVKKHIFTGGQFGGIHCYLMPMFLDSGDPYKFVSSFALNPGRGASVRGFSSSRDGRYLYVARETGLEIWDISDPARPGAVSFSDDIQYPYKDKNTGTAIARNGDLILFGTERDLRFFDVRNPAKPAALKKPDGKQVIYPAIGAVLAVKIHGNYAFLFYGPSKQREKGKAGLEIIDISNPSDPQFTDAIPLGEMKGSGMAQNVALSPGKKIIIIPAGDFYFLDVSDYIK